MNLADALLAGVLASIGAAAIVATLVESSLVSNGVHLGYGIGKLLLLAMAGAGFLIGYVLRTSVRRGEN